MSYIDENGNTILYRALYSVDKEGKKIIITSHCLNDKDEVIVNPRTKAYIQEQSKAQEIGIQLKKHMDDFIKVTNVSSNEWNEELRKVLEFQNKCEHLCVVSICCDAEPWYNNGRGACACSKCDFGDEVYTKCQNCGKIGV